MGPKKLAAASARLQRRAGGAIDVAIVLGSGLSETVWERITGSEIGYERLHLPSQVLLGHPGIAIAGTWASKRVVAFGGRVHLYQGYSAREVTEVVRLAAATGARTIVITNAAGGLNPQFAAGDIMLIRDHLNVTGATPLDGRAGDAFVAMSDAYAPHLRALAHRDVANPALREGVYAGVRGPQYETPAEAEALRRLGADAVGMSTVLETLAARALGCDVLGISVIANVLGSSNVPAHADVARAAVAAAPRLASLIETVIATL